VIVRRFSMQAISAFASERVTTDRVTLAAGLAEPVWSYARIGSWFVERSRAVPNPHTIRIRTVPIRALAWGSALG
jgi:hypothetical protein